MSSYFLLFESDADDYDYYWWTSGSTDLSKLISPKIDGNIEQCLTFW
jgi:hypothetical protein